MHSASFTINDSGIFGEITAKSNRTIQLWCNDRCDLLHIAGPFSSDMLSLLNETVGVQGYIQNGDEGMIVTEACLRDLSSGFLDKYAEEANCLLLSPLRYERGEKRLQIVALESAHISTFYQDLVEDGKQVTVQSKRKIQAVDRNQPLIAPNNLVAEFTRRQRQVIETAYEDGYYNIPRGTTTANIADKLGISRRTVEEHLRRAERKVMDGYISQL